MKKIFKSLVAVALALAIIIPATTSTAFAADQFGLSYANSVGLSNSSNPQQIAVNIIKIALGFLGILAVIIILLGGFKWMTAAGNEESVEEAKKILIAGVIGLVIILAAWGIASFVIDQMINNVLS
jgi:hypothetical protein